MNKAIVKVDFRIRKKDEYLEKLLGKKCAFLIPAKANMNRHHQKMQRVHYFYFSVHDDKNGDKIWDICFRSIFYPN